MSGGAVFSAAPAWTSLTIVTMTTLEKYVFIYRCHIVEDAFGSEQEP